MILQSYSPQGTDMTNTAHLLIHTEWGQKIRTKKECDFYEANKKVMKNSVEFENNDAITNLIFLFTIERC